MQEHKSKQENYPLMYYDTNMNKKKKRIKILKRHVMELQALKRYLKTQNEMLTQQSYGIIEENERLKNENERL